MRLGPLYHWSPIERRAAILAEGLVPGKPCVTATTELDYVCLGFSPSGAWELSADSLGDRNRHDVWDLWQVTVGDEDSVEIRPEFGPVLCEVMVHNPIPAGRLWLAGSRAVGFPRPGDIPLRPAPGAGNVFDVHQAIAAG